MNNEVGELTLSEGDELGLERDNGQIVIICEVQEQTFILLRNEASQKKEDKRKARRRNYSAEEQRDHDVRGYRETGKTARSKTIRCHEQPMRKQQRQHSAPMRPKPALLRNAD